MKVALDTNNGMATVDLNEITVSVVDTLEIGVETAVSTLVDERVEMKNDPEGTGVGAMEAVEGGGVSADSSTDETVGVVEKGNHNHF